MLQRAAYSPKEFSSLFGKSQTWGYRQIYAGSVETITQFGRIMIPATEVERIIQTAEIYSGQKPKSKAAGRKVRISEPESVWQHYMASRRRGEKLTNSERSAAPLNARRRIFSKTLGSAAGRRSPPKVEAVPKRTQKKPS